MYKIHIHTGNTILYYDGCDGRAKEGLNIVCF